MVSWKLQRFKLCWQEPDKAQTSRGQDTIRSVTSKQSNAGTSLDDYKNTLDLQFNRFHKYNSYADTLRWHEHNLGQRTKTLFPQNNLRLTTKPQWIRASKLIYHSSCKLPNTSALRLTTLLCRSDGNEIIHTLTVWLNVMKHGRKTQLFQAVYAKPHMNQGKTKETNSILSQ